METRQFRAMPGDDLKEILREPGEILREGGLVAFPTETVYGLGGDAENAESSRKIYAAKGRPSDNPLIVHIADFSQMEAIAQELAPQVRILADAFWPGPLTMIVRKNDRIPLETTGGLDTVAVRMPSHPVARQLILSSGCMIAAPSANSSGRPSPTRAEHVADDLSGKIDAIIDGGPVEIGLESTIVDLSEGIPTVLRPGYINLRMLEEVLGQDHVRMDPGLMEENVSARPKAPGMRYKHYAPRGDLKIVEGATDDVVETINRLSAEAIAAGSKVGVIASTETRSRYLYGDIVEIGPRSDEEEIARHLFGVLRHFDDQGIEIIYSEAFDTPQMGTAIMNRLIKAAAHQLILAARRVTRVIFVSGRGVCRAPMAAELLRRQELTRPIEIFARGRVALFPEPVNQKVQAVLQGKGIELADYESEPLKNEEITDSTLVFTMDAGQRTEIIRRFANADEDNTYVLSAYVGDELDILNPYGGNLQQYGLCFEVLNQTIGKLAAKLNELAVSLPESKEA